MLVSILNTFSLELICNSYSPSISTYPNSNLEISFKYSMLSKITLNKFSAKSTE